MNHIKLQCDFLKMQKGTRTSLCVLLPLLLQKVL